MASLKAEGLVRNAQGNASTSTAADSCSAATDMIDRQVGDFKQSKKAKGTGSFSRHDIAMEASLCMYSIITKILHESRDSAKAQIFIDVLYPLTGWSQFSVPVPQDKLKMYWADESMLLDTDLKAISVTDFVDVSRRFRVKEDEIEEAALNNRKRMKTEIERNKGMTLCIEHEVVVPSKIVH